MKRKAKKPPKNDKLKTARDLLSELNDAKLERAVRYLTALRGPKNDG